MENQVQLYNKRLNMWIEMVNGKAYDPATQIELPEDVADGAKQYLINQINILSAKLKSANSVDAKDIHFQIARLKCAIYE